MGDRLWQIYQVVSHILINCLPHFQFLKVVPWDVDSNTLLSKINSLSIDFIFFYFLKQNQITVSGMTSASIGIRLSSVGLPHPRRCPTSVVDVEVRTEIQSRTYNSWWENMTRVENAVAPLSVLLESEGHTDEGSLTTENSTRDRSGGSSIHWSTDDDLMPIKRWSFSKEYPPQQATRSSNNIIVSGKHTATDQLLTFNPMLQAESLRPI